MSERKETRLKLELSEHNAFWWFIKDLGGYLGKEIDLDGHTKALLNVYKHRMKEVEKGKYKQGKLL